MSSALRARSGAGRLERILTIALLRVAFAGALSLVALVAWMAAEPSVQGGHRGVESAAVAPGASAELSSARTDERSLGSRAAKQSARVVVRHLLLARARAGDGDGTTTLTAPLATTPAPLFGDIAQSARARLRRLAQSHPPYGDPSPFDATAPPTSSRRNG